MLRIQMFFVVFVSLASALKCFVAKLIWHANSSDYFGTRLMAARLRELHDRKDLDELLLTRPTAGGILKMSKYFYEIRSSSDTRSQILMDIKQAELLLLKGESRHAVEKYLRVQKRAIANRHLFSDDFLSDLRNSLAISYLRMAEQQNCILHHAVDSCIFPISESGIHGIQDGSRAAVKEYLSLLAEKPDDKTCQWLLNVAYMTLGQYPDNVPQQWLIPPDTFKSDYQIGRFYDVAPQAGLDHTGQAGGVVIDDFDGDGYQDVIISGVGLDQQLRYFHNNGDGTFSDRTAEARLTGITGGLQILHGDYNNDGHPDLLVLRGAWLLEEGKYPLSLLRNNGNGTFEDVTVAAGLLEFRPTQAAVMADFHNSGYLDLFVAYESITPEMVRNILRDVVPHNRQIYTTLRNYRPSLATFEKHPCALYRNNGDGTFTNVAKEAGVDFTGFFKGVCAGDYNNDGWSDIYISRVGQSNILLRNNGKDASGKITFSDVTAQAGVSGPLFSFSTWFWDYNNDGWLDIFAADVTDNAFKAAGIVADEYLGARREITCLYRNNRDGTFTNITKEAGLDRSMFPMGSNYGDLDNDGWLDFYLGTGTPDYRALVPNRMFRNVEGKYFQDVTTSGGFGHLQKGHGIAFADINEDGHQDIFIVLGGFFTGDTFRCALFENPGNANQWIKLKLEGVKSNRSAIGARIKISINTNEGVRNVYSVVSAGSSFGGNPLRREIGLGQAVSISNIEITWPASGIVQNFKDVAVNKSYKVREGDTCLTTVNVKSFKLGSTNSAPVHHHCAAQSTSPPLPHVPQA